MPEGLKRTDFYAAIRVNRRNTTILCAGLILVGGILGYAIGWSFETLAASQSYETVEPALSLYSEWGVIAAIFMLAFGLAWTIIALFVGDKIVIGLAGAENATQEQEPQLHNVVEEMAIAAGLPKPRIVIIETPALNAFATGVTPEKATIGVTRGLLDTLNRDELQGVVAHEMSHIANDDVLYATAIGVIVGLIAVVSELALRSVRHMRFRSSRSSKKGGGGAAIAILILILIGLLAPLSAKLVQMAISRQREYLADATAVRLSRHPEGLIAALNKIGGSSVKYEGASKAIQHLFIANPFRNFSETAGALFATHPAISLRIGRLYNLGGEGRPSPWIEPD